jgi:glycine cleavage system T protein
MQDQAEVVIIGGGILGASIAFHLAEAGCRDVILVDKGELTSGTTFHSVGLVSQFRTSPTLMKIMNYTIHLFNRLERDFQDGLGWRTVGSLRLASSKDRLKNLAREVSRAKAIGIDAEIISADQAVQMAPFIAKNNLYGAVYVPDDGHIDPSAITYALARLARVKGVKIYTNVRVTGLTVTPAGEITHVRTDHGDMRAGCVVNAAGEWAPQIGAMAGVHIPMVPLMHQYLTTKPIAGHELPADTPVVRDPDNLFYCREDVGAFLIGGFETNPKAWSTQGVPWSFNQQLLNAQWELFEPIMENALDRIPLLAEAEVIELINGPDAVTPDGHYALGLLPGFQNFYAAAGGSFNGIAGAGGIGKLMAEWIMEGAPSMDVHEMNVKRFGPHLKDLDHLIQNCREVYRYYYHIRYPHDENEWGRPNQKSPFYPKLWDMGAVFGEKYGWERVNYFSTGHFGRTAGADQKNWGWSRPPFFENIFREVKAARQKAALLDMTSFGKIEVSGPEALNFLQKLAVSDIDKSVGSVTYSQFLNEQGGIESDVTITRMNPTTFFIISGTAFVANDLGWLRMHRPAGESVAVADVTRQWSCLALCGPHARHILAAITATDLSNAAFPYLSAQYIDVAGVRVWAQRISYAGELGWELYIPWEQSLVVWDAMMEAGRPWALLPIGYKALDSLRLEKGYLYWSKDITPADNPLEAGLGFAVDFNKADFIGRSALLKIKADGMKRKLCAIVLDAQHGLFGGESVYHNGRLIDRIRSAAYGHTIGMDIGLVYLPHSLATAKTQLEVDVMGRRIAAEVAAKPLVDACGKRLRA